jgi:hypothetical protein
MMISGFPVMPVFQIQFTGMAASFRFNFCPAHSFAILFFSFMKSKTNYFSHKEKNCTAICRKVAGNQEGRHRPSQKTCFFMPVWLLVKNW